VTRRKRGLGPAPRGLAPLRHRSFRLLVAGQLASNVGDAFYVVALPWYVLAEHGGAVLLGTVLAAYGVPRTVALAVGGHMSDKWRPWTVMMTSDAVRAVAAAMLAAAAATRPPRVLVLVPIAAVLGAGEGVFLPGSFSIVPALLPDQDLQAGNSLVESETQLAALAGPVIGGAMVALLGPAPAFALDAASFVISAMTLARMFAIQRSAPIADSASADGARQASAVPAQAAAPAANPGAAAPTVLGLFRSDQVLKVYLLVIVAANLGTGGLFEVALPSLAHGPLHAGARGYGALIAAFGVGALIGTLTAGQLRRARRPAIVGSIAFLAGAIFSAAVPYLGGTLAAGAALIAFGSMNGFGNVVTMTAFQRWAPPDLLGRLTGLLLLAMFGVFPISVALGALVVHDLGPAPFFPLAAASLAIALLVGLSQRSWRDFGAEPQSPPAGLTASSTSSSQSPPAPLGSAGVGDLDATPHPQPD
jgi:MFS family permease